MTADNPDQKPEQAKQGIRQKIGKIDDPFNKSDLKKLTPQQVALREAIINEYKAKKVKKFADSQITHINSGRQLAESIRFLFDDKGRPPANAPLEDLIEDREKIEYQIRWLEALATELRNTLGKIIEFENDALDLLRQNQERD
jgi:hypothetical protein